MIGEAANDPGVLIFFHAKNGGFLPPHVFGKIFAKKVKWDHLQKFRAEN